MNLTTEELDRLKSCKSDEDWNKACAAVKAERNGAWPPDWYEKVIATKLVDQVLGAGAGDISLNTVNINAEGKLETEEVARFSPGDEPLEESEEDRGAKRWPAPESLAWAKYRLRLMEVHLEHLESFQEKFVDGDSGTHPFTTSTILASMKELEKTGGMCEQVLTRIHTAAEANELAAEFDTEEEATEFINSMTLLKAESNELYERYGLFQFKVLSGLLPFTKGEKERMVRNTVEAFKKHFGQQSEAEG